MYCARNQGLFLLTIHMLEIFSRTKGEKKSPLLSFLRHHRNVFVTSTSIHTIFIPTTKLPF